MLYKIISDIPYTLEERTQPSTTAPKTGKVFKLGDEVEISKIQVNAPGAEWGNTPGGWIATTWNGKLRVEPVGEPTPVPDPTPLPSSDTFTITQTFAIRNDATGEVWVSPTVVTTLVKQ